MMRSCLSISKPSGGGPVGQPSRRYPTVRYTFLFLLLDEKCNLKKSRYLGERRSYDMIARKTGTAAPATQTHGLTTAPYLRYYVMHSGMPIPTRCSYITRARRASGPFRRSPW